MNDPESHVRFSIFDFRFTGELSPCPHPTLSLPVEPKDESGRERVSVSAPFYFFLPGARVAVLACVPSDKNTSTSYAQIRCGIHRDVLPCSHHWLHGAAGRDGRHPAVGDRRGV